MEEKSTKKLLLISAFLGVIFVMIAQGIVSPHMNLRVLHKEGMFWVAILTFSFMMARSVGSMFHAALLNATSPRFTGLLGLFMILGCYISYWYLPIYLYPVVRVFEGFAAGIFWPLLQSFIVMGTDPKYRSRMMSVYFIAGNLSGFVGYQIGAMVYKAASTKGIVISGSFIVIFLGLLYFIITPSVSAKKLKRSVKEELRVILKEIGRVKKYIPLMFITGGIGGLFKDYLFAYVQQVTGYPEPSLRHFWSIMGYTALGLSFLFSYIFESKGKEKGIFALSTFMVLSIVFLPLTSSPLIVLLLLSFSTTGTRTLRPILRGHVSKTTSKPEFGIALVNSISNIAAAIVPLVLGIVFK